MLNSYIIMYISNNSNTELDSYNYLITAVGGPINARSTDVLLMSQTACASFEPIKVRNRIAVGGHLRMALMSTSF